MTEEAKVTILLRHHEGFYRHLRLQYEHHHDHGLHKIVDIDHRCVGPINVGERIELN